ncbi:MAG TPA: histidine kinase [Blastocatellia bacterium]|nr:histidine kinase [Blastocatellia bacterium]
MPNRHRTFWLLVLIMWSLVGLSFTLNYYLFADHYVAIFKERPTLKGMLVWELPYWFLWAAIAPLVFWLTGRFRIDRERWFRNSLLHIFACLFLSVAHRAVYLIIGWLLHVAAYQQMSSIPELYESDILFNLPTGFMSYGTILLVSQAVDYHNRYQEEELKISRLKAELAEAQLQVAQAQLQALKMQLHPHFLFNTLNSISALLDEDVEAADEMIARLGDFLRLTLENSGAQEVTLQEELEFLRCYLEIEQVRFQDRLTVRMDIGPETLDARVPNLILQPIVENAIRHGIVAQMAPGRIEVRASRVGETLQLQVKDNGPGLSPTQDSAGKLRGGLGLANTRARLEQLYGPAHHFDMSDATEGGLQVTLEIPFETTNVFAGEERLVAR